MGLYESLKSSGRNTSSTVVMDAPGYFGGILIETDGTDDVVVNGYDYATTSASGTKLFPQITVAGADNYGGFFPPKPIRCDLGCYITVSGDGTEAFVAYTRKQ